MISIEKAKKAFAEYVSKYNVEDEKIAIKIKHTYRVVESSEYIAKKIGLGQEDIALAMLIGILHDIGRFEQAKQYHTFVDSKSFDHADFGVEVLFKDNLIREFIEDEKYDDIIKKSIRNHNKYTIEEGMNERELIHSKIIRDSDKVDNLNLIYLERLEVFPNRGGIAIEKITDKVFNDFVNHKTILNADRITNLDFWISYIAWIFDLNFDASIQLVKEKDYINPFIDYVDCKNEDVKNKMEIIRKIANEFLNN
ncbi:MAG: HD domain-containing protein [Clostridia bacterium]